MESDITESDITEKNITESDRTEIDITEFDITVPIKLLCDDMFTNTEFLFPSLLSQFYFCHLRHTKAHLAFRINTLELH